jgi:hypothetical protein
VVVAVAVLAVMIIRQRGGDAPPVGDALVTATTALPSPATLEPAPSAVTTVGPTTTVGGVPMGYAHSPAGAEAAAIGFLQLDQALVAMTDEQAAAAKRVIAASSVADALVADVVAKLDALRTGYPGGATLFRIGVLATRVSPSGADRVRVEIWHVGVVSPPGAVPYDDWTTQRYELVWERDDWRIAGEASTPGPRPLSLPATNPAGAGQLEAALAGFGPAGVSR